MMARLNLITFLNIKVPYQDSKLSSNKKALKDSTKEFTSQHLFQPSPALAFSICTNFTN